MIKIYSENFDNRFKAAERSGNMTEIAEAEVFRDCVPEKLLECGYDDVKAAREYLDDDGLMDTLGEYYSLGEKYDWLIDTESMRRAQT